MTAQQPDNEKCAPAAPVVQRLRIDKADQTISTRTFNDPPYGPDDLRFEPDASSGLPVSVSTKGTCAHTGSSLRVPGSGTCVAKMEQAGNDDFYEAPAVTVAFEVVAEPLPC